jgi:outer membrane protein TolC
VSLARKSLDINKESLSLGYGHATDVVRAQLAVNLAKIQNLNISMLTMQNRVDIHLAIGGGFTRQ